HYKIWYFLFTPAISFVFPWDYLRFREVFQYLKSSLFKKRVTALNHGGIGGLDASHSSNNDILHNFTISVNKSTPDIFYYTFIVFWIIGMAIFIGVTIYANYQIHQIKKSATTIKDEKINKMLEMCKEVVGVKRKIMLQETSLITSPITLGIMQPYIFLPVKTKDEVSLNQLKYVLLHELSHQKGKDILINYIMWLFQIIYWFNPLAWIALKRMRIDRELACDASVLSLLDENGYKEYGYTIIQFAGKKHDRAYGQLSSGIGGTKKQIKQRIQSIANYSGDSPLLKWKGKVIYAFLGILVLFFTSVTSAIASSDNAYHFKEENVQYEDLSDYFNGFKGSFVLYDATKKQYQIYNRGMSEQRISPDSTYKIYSGLFALETNAISPKNNEQLWDGTIYPFEKWNENQTISTALGNSVNWYFQRLDNKVGKKRLQYYFHKINYGNEDLSGGIDNYWLESSLKISPIEQVKLLRAFDKNTFGFKEENIRSVKKALFIEGQKQDQLYGKTGTGTVNGKDINGWFIGFVKKDNHIFYFAINIQNKNGNANGTKAADIAKQILHEKHIF
ncbi:MAG: BlaR1 family beta-lactam sensor/signal transducer, partial [Heyndrickxia sp.]